MTSLIGLAFVSGGNLSHPAGFIGDGVEGEVGGSMTTV